jgi:hypothetical protein
MPVKTVFQFDAFTGADVTPQDVTAAIAAAPHLQGRTWTDEALAHIRTETLLPSNGCRRDDPDVQQVVLIISDGASNAGHDPIEEAELLREPYKMHVFRF